jgi:glucose/arabinose dehydrogenase
MKLALKPATRVVAGCLAVLALVGCGGGNESAPQVASSAQALPEESDDVRQIEAAAALAEVTWVHLANHPDAFTVDGTQLVRFGVDTRWVEKYVTGNGWCTNSFFGFNPAVGVLKTCELQVNGTPPPPPPPSTTVWTHIADHPQPFTVVGTKLVRFGVDTRWVQRNVTANGWCTNTFFGSNPAPGVLKTCEVASTVATPNIAPVATITSPDVNATFKAGDTMTFAGSGSDAEDGPLAAARLTWWAELRHDVHGHPMQPETVGAGGTVTIPVRGETSPNVWYRFYLRATDSAGATNVVTRDIQPQKAQVTLATVPAGLALTLDGQPVTAPSTFTGVVGIERDLAAVAQNFNGRRYQFTGWSDGGAATHTISTPAANTTYTATFTDIGPVVNNAPVVAMANPANGSSATSGVSITLIATATDNDDRVTGVEFFENGIKVGATATTAPYSVPWSPAVTGIRSLTARATDNFGLSTTSAAVTVTVSAPTGGDTQAPVATLGSPANLASGLIGTINLSATATDNVGVTALEFQVDGTPVGAIGGASPYTVGLDTTAYASGQHIVRTRARDAAGNASPWASATVSFGGGRTQPAGFTRNESWITGLSNATAFTQAPDGRLFVAQQGGALRIVKNGVLMGTPFISLTVDSAGERGLIGVALHPGFASNRYVYVYRTTPENGAHNRISRFTADATNPDVVAAGSELVIADLPALSSATNHNGGAMNFGIDGKLYVAVGENANSANSQNLATPLGKMLRFNDDGTIPSDNPFYASQTGLARAIWASGLRNPFTFAVQAGSGRMYINDVGQDVWEEVNLGAPGANYGWPASEGPVNITAGITAPLFTYKHSAASPAGSGPGGFFVGFAITGGAFYPDSGAFPAAYRNGYYFADYVSRYVGRLDLANNHAAYAFATVTSAPVGLQTGVDGALYVLTRDGIVRISFP